MSNPRCNSCRFFQGTYGIHGECRRNAPVRGEKSYPETATNHWCGQHDSRPGKGDNVVAIMKEMQGMRDGLVLIARLWRGNAKVDFAEVPIEDLVSLIVDSVQYDQGRLAEWNGEAANMPSEVTPTTPPASPPPPPMDVIARLEAEATQLGDRIAKLQSFLADSAKTKSIPLEDKNDLATQLAHMMSYQKVLKRRMNRYNRINALARAALTRANGCTSPGCCGGGTTNGESPP